MQKFYLSQAITSRRRILGKSVESRLKAFLQRWVKKSQVEEGYAGIVSRRLLQQYLNVSKDEIDEFLKELVEADVVELRQVPGARKERYVLDVTKAKYYLTGVAR